MLLLTILLWLMLSVTSVQAVCTVHLTLDCSNHTNVFATWNTTNGCVVRDCTPTWHCTNGKDSKFSQRDDCVSTWENFTIPWKYYSCNLTMDYFYRKGFDLFKEVLIDSCSAYAVDMQLSYDPLVNDPLEIHCSVNTVNITNSAEVTVSWTGPNGATITNDGRLTITPTVSNGTNHISTLQFSYLREDDKGLYECTSSLQDTIASITLANVSIPTPNVTVTALNNQQVGDTLLLECNVTTVRGITSSVDIVWITNGTEVGRVNNASGEPAGNTVVYSNTYSSRSLLSEDDDDAKYQCYVKINANLLVDASSTYIVNIQSMEDQILVGSPYEIACPIFASGEFNSTFIWTGPNGVITDDDRLTAVTSSISNDTTTFTSSLQFSYLSEDDEGSYRCDVIVFGYNNNYSTSSSVKLTDFTVPTPRVTVTALNNQQVGDPLLLECYVTTVRGITSSVDIVWIINDEEVVTVSNVPGIAVDNSLVYSSIYSDSEPPQDNRMYQCFVKINASLVINTTNTFVFTIPTVSSTGASSSYAAIITSIFAAVVTLTLALTILGYFIYKKRRNLVKWDPPKPEHMAPPIDDDTDYSVIGKEAPSTCEYLENEKVLHWIKDAQMTTIDEESTSIHSVEMTNDDMLNLVYGGNGKSIKGIMEKQCDHNEISTTKDPYLSESVVFCSSDKQYSTSSSTMSDDNFQATLGDYYCEDSSHDSTKNKHNSERDNADCYSGTYYVDYDIAKTASLPHKGYVKQTDESTVEVAKGSEGDHLHDMPYIPASDDTGVYTGSYFSENSIPPPDGAYTSCSIAMHPLDNNTTPYTPTATSPTFSHHSDKSMPFGEYMDHDVAVQRKNSFLNIL